MDALGAMKIEAGDVGEIPPWRPVVPPTQPPPRIEFPKPDWRAEERERLAREREPVDVPDKSKQRWPA